MAQIKIAPSILSADFAHLGRDTKNVMASGADLVHIDVMDGHFVPNLTIGAPVVASLRKEVTNPFDVHLMISDPLKYIKDFAKAGADIITFHYEADSDIASTIAEIKEYGIKPSISVKPGTDINVVFPYLKDLHMVLIMTVEPGFGGQSFMADMVSKISSLKAEADKVNPDLLIEVDGGIDTKTAPTVVSAGANVLVAGSAVFRNGDYKNNIDGIRSSVKDI